MHRSTVQQLVLSEQERRVTDWRREGRWEMVELKGHIFSNRRQRASCNATHIWCWRNAHSHLRKFATWRFVCRRFIVLLLLLRRFSSVRLCETPWTAVYQAPPSLGFSRQEYWSGVPLPSPGDLLYMRYFKSHHSLMNSYTVIDN